jgi:hypothetical protein
MPKALVLVLVNKTRDVLEQKDLRAHIAEHPEIGRKGIRTRIVESPGVAPRPIAGFRKWLARRAAHKDIGLAGSKSGRRENIFGRYRKNVPFKDGPPAIQSYRATRHAVHLNSDSGAEARGLNPEIEASNSCV